MVLGRDLKVGNLTVENIFDRRIEIITKYMEIISIDNNIKNFYNAEIVNGLNGLPDFKPQSKVPKFVGDRYAVKPVMDDIGDAQDTESMTVDANALLIFTI